MPQRGPSGAPSTARREGSGIHVLTSGRGGVGLLGDHPKGFLGVNRSVLNTNITQSKPSNVSPAGSGSSAGSYPSKHFSKDSYQSSNSSLPGSAQFPGSLRSVDVEKSSSVVNPKKQVTNETPDSRPYHRVGGLLVEPKDLNSNALLKPNSNSDYLASFKSQLTRAPPSLGPSNHSAQISPGAFENNNNNTLQSFAKQQQQQPQVGQIQPPGLITPSNGGGRDTTNIATGTQLDLVNSILKKFGTANCVPSSGMSLGGHIDMLSANPGIPPILNPDLSVPPPNLTSQSLPGGNFPQSFPEQQRMVNTAPMMNSNINMVSSGQAQTNFVAKPSLPGDIPLLNNGLNSTNSTGMMLPPFQQQNSMLNPLNQHHKQMLLAPGLLSGPGQGGGGGNHGNRAFQRDGVKDSHKSLIESLNQLNPLRPNFTASRPGGVSYSITYTCSCQKWSVCVAIASYISLCLTSFHFQTCVSSVGLCHKLLEYLLVGSWFSLRHRQLLTLWVAKLYNWC